MLLPADRLPPAAMLGSDPSVETQRSSAPVLLPHHPETSSSKGHKEVRRKELEVLGVPDILREIRGLPTEPQGNS